MGLLDSFLRSIFPCVLTSPLLLARFSQWERIVTQNIITDRQYKRARMWIVSLLVLSNSIFDIFDNLWMIWLSGNNWPWLRLLRQIVFCICSQWQCTETMNTVNDANWFIKLQSGEFCMVLSCIVQWLNTQEQTRWCRLNDEERLKSKSGFCC